MPSAHILKLMKCRICGAEEMRSPNTIYCTRCSPPSGMIRALNEKVAELEQERHELRQQVADLERERDDAIEWRDSWRTHYDALRQRVETLEEALRWYADEDNYPNRCGDCWVRADIQDDGGQKAHAALAGQPPSRPRTTALADAAREAAEWLESRPDYTEGDAAVASRLRGAITDHATKGVEDAQS